MGEPDVAKMTRRTTQRALYTSLLSIVACALMLFGTTFAWFSASTTSGANTLTAANFDVDVSATSLDAGIHTVTLTRLGGGSAPGYCQFTLTMSGTYVQTTTVTYSDGSSQQGEPTQQTLNDTQLCRANFSEGIETISFTLSLTNATASIAELSSSWGSCTEGDGVMLRSRSAQPAAMEITDGATIEFGMEDQEVECAATDEQEAELAAEKEREAAEQAETEAETVKENSTEPAEQTDTQQINDNEDDNHDANDTDSAGAGEPEPDSSESAIPTSDGNDEDI